MKTRQITPSSIPKRPRHPAVSAAEKELELVGLATECAEKQLREGTATAQVICHYLKLGSSSEQKKTKLLEKQIEYLEAKISAIQSQQHTEELFTRAIDSMRRYSGSVDA